MSMPREPLLSESEVRKLLGIGKISLHRWVKTGEFPTPLRIGPRRIAWTCSTFDRWIQKRELRAREDHMRRLLARQKCKLGKEGDAYTIVDADDAVLADGLTLEGVEAWADA